MTGTGQFLNSTRIRTNQSNKGIRLSSLKELVDNVEIKEPLGSRDHNQMHFNISIKSDKTQVKQCRRDFRKGNYKEIRKSLALIDGNDKMKNKTATECWNIVKLNFSQYPSIHTNYIISHCTTLCYNHNI